MAEIDSDPFFSEIDKLEDNIKRWQAQDVPNWEKPRVPPKLSLIGQISDWVHRRLDIHSIARLALEYGYEYFAYSGKVYRILSPTSSTPFIGISWTFQEIKDYWDSRTKHRFNNLEI